MVKKIVLQPSEDGYYRFDELPYLIERALHPEDGQIEDWLTRAIIWKADGTPLGQFFECTPPENERAHVGDDLTGWVCAPIEASEQERREPDRFRWMGACWHELRRPEEERRYWHDGSLLVTLESTQHGLAYQLSSYSEYEWYKKRMEHDARLDGTSLNYLCVVDGNRNELAFKLGAALGRGWVHIDELNRWGATLRPASVFKAIESRPTCAPSSIDFSVLASPEQLIRAFGAFTGMEKSWFSNITDKPKLLKARKHEGKGGKNYANPWFCPFEVMLWLVC